MRPIDGDAFTNHVALYMAENAYLNDTALDVLKKISKWLEEEPTLDYAPIRHGEWVDGRPYTNSRWKVCSVCHESGVYPNGGTNYCPNCGAKMDGGENGKNV